MNITEIAEAIAELKEAFPGADDFPVRFYGGQGGVIRVHVERDDRNVHEVVFHTSRGY